MPTGSFFEDTSFGLGSNQPILTALTTAIGGGAVDTSFTMPGQTTLDAAFFLAGNLIATEVIPNGGIFMQSLDEITHPNFCCPLIVGGGVDQQVAFTVFTPDDETFLVDDYEVSAPAPLSFAGYSSLSFTAGGGITSFTIVGEQLQTVPEPNTFSMLTIGLGLAGAFRVRRKRLTSLSCGSALNLPVRSVAP
jgi:hypothetical protein